MVFLVFWHDSAPQEYKDRCAKYWRQVGEQLLNLESKAGAVKHVYHEAIHETGEAGLALVKKFNPSSHDLVAARCADGATLEALEDRELAAEVSDWERFLMMGYSSSKVGDLVRDLYAEAVKRSNEHVVKVMDSTLGAGEAGLLLIGEGHRLQFPSDIEVFSVVPPALDELHRWLRDQASRPGGEEDADAAAEEAAGTDGEKDGEEA